MGDRVQALDNVNRALDRLRELNAPLSNHLQAVISGKTQLKAVQLDEFCAAIETIIQILERAAKISN
jgi:hypothetical protein